jgi:hypothetical protein
MCWPEALTLSTSENTYTTEVARVVREIFAAQDGTQGTSCSNRDTRPKPSCPALVALTVSLAPWGAGWRPIGRLCAPATLRLSLRLAKGRGRRSETEPTAARRSRESGRIHPSRPAIPEEVPFRTTPNQTHRGVGAIMGRQWASAGSPRALSSVPWRACVLGLSTSDTDQIHWCHDALKASSMASTHQE